MRPDWGNSDSCDGLRKGHSRRLYPSVTEIKGAVRHNKGLSAWWPAHPQRLPPAILSDGVDKLPLAQQAGQIPSAHSPPPLLEHQRSQ